MVIRRQLRLAAAACGVFSAAAWSQEQPAKRLSAREMFYAIGDQPGAPAQSAVKPRASKAPEPRAARKPEKAPPRGSGSAAAPAERAGAAKNPDVVPAAYVPAVSHPLGIRYTVLKRADERMVEVAPETVFRAGDRIQFSVEPNDSGYLYIIHQGSSGTWKPLFPSEEIEDGNNRVERGRVYTMPPKSRFFFDEQPGVEKIFIVLSRRPEADLERMIYSLQEGGTRPAAEPAQPEEPKQLLVASSTDPIDDSVVGRLRKVYSRDLVIEKVDEDQPGGRREKAIYVVNPSGSADARVVADIRLDHR